MNNLVKQNKARAILEVNLKNLKNNCEVLKKLNSSDSFFCPMVKDQAYGHGLIPVTKSLLGAGIKQVGVIDLEEAYELRKSIKSPFDILIFGTFLNQHDILWAVENNLVLVINNQVDLAYLESIKKPVRIHLKFDTGFSRLGFSLLEAKKLKDILDNNPHIQLEGLCTQLICSTELGDTNSDSYQQVKQLQSVASHFPSCHLHAFNSAALFSVCKNNLSEFYSIGARPGISLYGVQQDCFVKQNANKIEVSLMKVSSLKSYVVGVHHLKNGDKVSYDGNWVAKKDSVVATVCLGYGDGFLRAFGSKREVLLRGYMAPVVGNVCMDFFMIDATKIYLKSKKPVSIGEEVLIFGQQDGVEISIENQSQQAGTIPYEFFVNLGRRVQRIYIS